MLCCSLVSALGKGLVRVFVVVTFIQESHAVFGDIFSAIGNVVGGLSSAFGGSDDDRGSGLGERGVEITNQNNFAQQGIRWRVADAQAAGIHPLYALGANLPTYSPVNYYEGNNDTGVASHLANFGQDISRAIDSTRTHGERVTARSDALHALQLERGALENELLRAQIAKLQAAQVGPPGPSSDARLEAHIPPEARHLVKVEPVELNASATDKPFLEAGATSDVSLAQTPGGGYAIMPSKDVKERMEDMFVPETMWSFRNLLVPWWDQDQQFRPSVPLKPGHVWKYNRWTGEFRQVPFPMHPVKPRYRRRVTF